MRPLPGRKSMVLFSEGIAIPPAVQRLFLGVIDAANRANVSIYTMDAAGLRAESEQAKIRDQVNQAASAASPAVCEQQDANDGLDKALEKKRTCFAGPTQRSRRARAGTGGLIFDNTNNLRQGFDRVESDLRNYYLLGYTPVNENFDGDFRKIDVKVKRSGVTVAARKGYFAVRNTAAARSIRGRPPRWGPRTGARAQRVPGSAPECSFRSRTGRGWCPVIVDLKTAPLTFQPTEDQKTFTSDFAVDRAVPGSAESGRA